MRGLARRDCGPAQIGRVPGRGRDAAGTRPGGYPRSAVRARMMACARSQMKSWRARGRLRQRGTDFAVPRYRRRWTALGVSHARSRRRHTAWALHHSPMPCSKRCSDTVTAREPAALNRLRATCVIDACRGSQSVIGREDPRPILRSGRWSPQPRLCTGPAPSR
jgi:hypothetical protein